MSGIVDKTNLVPRRDCQAIRARWGDQKMTKFSRLIIIAAIASGWSSVSLAQDTNLMMFGDFQTGATNEIGGIDSYVINCNENAGICEDNVGNAWGFGSTLSNHRVALCEELFSVASFNCVRTIEVNVQLSEPYSGATLELQRRRCGKQEIYFNGDMVGRVRGPSNSAGLHVNVEYFLGLLTPGKSHSFVLTAPESDQTECAGGNQIILINGLRIRGEPISRR
jgi:hypothetical protein